MSKRKRAIQLVGKTVDVNGYLCEVLEVGVYPGGFGEDLPSVCTHRFHGVRVRFVEGGKEQFYRLSARMNFVMGDKVKK